MERLREMVAQADRTVSELENRVDLLGPAESGAAERERLLAELRRASEAVWAVAARYLHVVDGFETEGPEGVVQVAGHTGLLGADEAGAARRLLQDRDARGLDGEILGRLPDHVRFLRLWLERVRDTIAKAHD